MKRTRRNVATVSLSSFSTSCGWHCRGTGALRLLTDSTLLPTVLHRDPAAALHLLRHAVVHRGVGGPTYRAFLPPPPPVAPARQRGDARDVQPPHHSRIGLPRLSDDRRGLHDYRLPVWWRFVGGGRRWHWRGIRVVLVRAAAASSPRLARGGANVHEVEEGGAYSEVALPLPSTFRELPGLVGVSRA